ncbi:nicotinate-nucleotide adenylyltransferase [Salinisphaera sp. T31B1]|uniref:nicotinate-nucleotide adenylyltransferase n=1 Tax=Salinisphaera sp. T31B1 TaxID=727963 RepID=UPI0033408429
MNKAPVGVLGGTFDPVHNGHLRLAMEMAIALGMDHVRLVPCARPPHRNAPTASPGQRAKWIRVAVSIEPRLRLDDRELLRSGPSYTVDTLASMRTEMPDTPLCLIMGRDVFAHLPKWHQWERLFDSAHIVLIDRPDIQTELHPEAEKTLASRAVDDVRHLHDELSGHIYSYAPPPLAISASRIRDLLGAGESPRYLLPTAVLDDIMDAGVYMPSKPQPATAANQ